MNSQETFLLSELSQQIQLSNEIYVKYLVIEFSMNNHIKITNLLWIVFESIATFMEDWLVVCETIYSIKYNDNLDQYNMLRK